MEFLQLHLGKILVVFLSIVLLVATEKWFPTADDDVARAQKHFWSVMLFIFSIVFGLSIESAFGVSDKVEQLSSLVGQHAQVTEQEEKIHHAVFGFEQVMRGATISFRKWGNDSLTALEKDLDAGYIPISKEQAPVEIGAVYQEAKGSIIASNVGSIDFYFNSPAYRDQNIGARNHHVPVVRFFIYSKSKDVSLSDTYKKENLDAKKIEDFSKCVEQLNVTLGSLCSIVVDWDAHYRQLEDAKDLLILDDMFVAETEISSTDWGPKRARATENSDRLKETRRYFHTLWGITGDNCVGFMKDKEIAYYFPQFKNLKPQQGQTLADTAFHQVLEKVAGRM
jgi:hypothetical protein